jgi:8-oxo-dGTP diphosphatase
MSAPHLTAPSAAAQSVPELQLAAGGIVWRKQGTRFKLAVIHRPKYDDWTLPKGKPDPNENLVETARREVREELGCEVHFLDFVGTTHYHRADNKLKLVLFWNMIPASEFAFEPNNEVDAVEWLTVEEAMLKLDHPVERELLGKCSPPNL